MRTIFSPWLTSFYRSMTSPRKVHIINVQLGKCSQTKCTLFAPRSRNRTRQHPRSPPGVSAVITSYTVNWGGLFVLSASEIHSVYASLAPPTPACVGRVCLSPGVSPEIIQSQCVNTHYLPWMGVEGVVSSLGSSKHMSFAEHLDAFLWGTYLGRQSLGHRDS